MKERDVLLASLKELGLLRNRDVERALGEVDQRRFLPRPFPAQRPASAGRKDIRVEAQPPEETFDRILVMDPGVPRPRALVERLQDMGFLIARGRGVEDLAFVKMVRQGGETLRLSFSQAPSPALAGPRASG